MATVMLLTIRFDGVPGATGYEIRKDGRVVSKTGANARQTRISVGTAATKISVIDLPARSLEQIVDFSQVQA